MQDPPCLRLCEGQGRAEVLINQIKIGNHLKPRSGISCRRRPLWNWETLSKIRLLAAGQET